MSSSPQNRVQPRTVKGFRDLEPDEAFAKSQMMHGLGDLARLHGFQSIATPALEFAEVLLGSSGDETDKEVYRFDDPGGRALALRFDLTVPFARYVAERQGAMTFPFKRFQCDEVWRGEKPQKGRYRQFCQADFDIVGVDSWAADVEVMSLLQKGLAQFCGGPFTMRINSRPVLGAAIKRAYRGHELTEAEFHRALIAIDKKEKVGREAVTKMLLDIHAGSGAGVSELLDLMESGESGLDRLAAWVGSEQSSGGAGGEGGFAESWSRLLKTRDAVKAICAASGGTTRVDLSVARGLGYYTGVVFETTLDELPGFGAVASGGRYDRLVERFVNRNLPGVGGSIGVDRLLAGLQELGRIEKNSGRPAVVIAVADPEALVFAHEVATKMRATGKVINVSVQIGAKQLGQQFKYADRLGARFVLTIGESERLSNKFNWKDLSNGQELRGVSLDECMEVLSR